MKTSWRLGVLAVLLFVACDEPEATRGQVPSASAIRAADIGFYEARVARDPRGARDRAALGALYLARARADGNEQDLKRAESLSQESWRVRHARNPDALSTLIGTLLAQHRFVEARAVARELVALDSSAVARATLGEVNLELGRYAEADQLFQGLSVLRTQPAIAPRYARWLELNGKSGEARALLEQVRGAQASVFRVPMDQLAWFDLRIGDLAFRNGRGDLAEAAYHRGLSLNPADPRLLTALAQLRAGQGRWAESIALGDSAMATVLDPATLGLLSRAYLASGDRARSAEYARAAQVAVSGTSDGFHRGWALFLLDQGKDVPGILARALSDLRERKDVYGYDLAAWALFHAGRTPEAMVFADSALRRGTRDAMLHAHAAAIAGALGDAARARRELDTAREISPLVLTLTGPVR